MSRRLAIVWRDRLLAELLVASLDAPDLRVVAALPLPPDSGALAERIPAAADLILVDGTGTMPPVVRAVAALDRRRPRLCVVVYGLADATQAVRLVEVGVEGFALAADSLAALHRVLDGARRRRPVCSLEVAERLSRRIDQLAGERSATAGDTPAQVPAPSSRRTAAVGAATPAAGLLTPRERQVLGLLALGLPNKDISSRLAISTSTVKNHVHNLLARLDVPDRRLAVEKARAYGLLRPRRPRI